ncbi:MAG TPA: hypothetical protein VJA47_00240 [archaeon]|nr:hypothetical protein [archaeon]
MKIYVAAKLENKESVKGAHRKLADKGHEITHDWTEHKDIRPYDKNRDMAVEYSTHEIKAVKDSDVFILLSEKDGGTGMHIEFGMALILNKLFGKPKVYVVGQANSRSTFYFQDCVKRAETLEEVLKEL